MAELTNLYYLTAAGKPGVVTLCDGCRMEFKSSCDEQREVTGKATTVVAETSIPHGRVPSALGLVQYVLNGEVRASIECAEHLMSLRATIAYGERLGSQCRMLSVTDVPEGQWLCVSCSSDVRTSDTILSLG